MCVPEKSASSKRGLLVAAILLGILAGTCFVELLAGRLAGAFHIDPFYSLFGFFAFTWLAVVSILAISQKGSVGIPTGRGPTEEELGDTYTYECSQCETVVTSPESDIREVGECPKCDSNAWWRVDKESASVPEDSE